MINGRSFISVFIFGLIVTTAVHADLVSVSQSDSERLQSTLVYNQLDTQQSISSNLYNFTNVANLDTWPDGFYSKVNIDNKQPSEIQHIQSFANGPGSLNLCLSALLGLGLCSSAHFVKKFSFNYIPEWYHNGGPFQIGHSHAVMPESLCPVAVYCFVQPTCMVEDYNTQYRSRTIVSLWRKSQFTPAVIASRGPPLTS